MKKIYMSALVLLGPSLLVAATDKGRLYDAIETLKHDEVKKYLRRLGELAPKEKQALVGAAEDALETQESRASVFKSPWDLGKALGGSVMGLIFALAGYRGYEEINDSTHAFDKNDKPAAILCALFSISSFYLAFRGFSCTAAQDRIATAKRIVKEIEKAPEEEKVA